LIISCKDAETQRKAYTRKTPRLCVSARELRGKQMERHKSGLRCSRWFGVTLLVAGMMILSSGSALSGDLLRLITITSYKVGSLGYIITSGFREAIEKLTPMKVRVEPYGTDVARTLPLKMKESEIALMGGASGTCVSYGTAEFSAKEWGPQPLRQVWGGMNGR
jgi:hypothetical protein